jgi:RNA polymerase sigma-70 factor (ECF subfamily)
LPIDVKLVDRLYARARGDRWRVSKARFADVLELSARRSGADREPRTLEGYLAALHLEDLALACACADGDETAWEHFIREHRPVLYRAADALDPAGGARDLADSLYAELFGLRERDGRRQSLFHYFHGRSSLATWLRAVFAQRYVDRARAARRVDPLPEEESPGAIAVAEPAIDPDRNRYLDLMRVALTCAVANLRPRDRLRLACYYAQELTLAETGRVLGEHEATVSRHLTRTRKTIRQDVEGQLRGEHRLTDAEITRCFESVTEDVGPLDLQDVIVATSARKESAVDRSS